MALLLAIGGHAQAQVDATITLTKSASPTTYTAAGQLINYTYNVTNDAGSAREVNAISVTDSNAAVIVSCPNVTLNPGESTNCTASYTVQAADVGSEIVNTAQATAQICGGDCGTATSNTAQATVPFVGTPSWTLTKTPNPTIYTAAGQTVTYSYGLTNTGNVSISAITMTDDKVSGISCAANTLAAGASTTCTGSYVTTGADVTAGSVTNHATAHGTPASGTLADGTAQATVTYHATTGSITIIKNASGGNGTFNFTSTIAGATSFTLTTANGTASRAFAKLTAGTYTFTETSLPADWRLTALSCSGDNGGTPTTVDLIAGGVSIGLDSAENITCTFTNTFDTSQHAFLTQQVIRRFLAHRMTLMLSDEPDRPRFLRRVPGSLWGDTGSTTPFSFTGSTSGLGSHMVFSTSLAQLARAEAKADDQTAGTVFGGALAYAGEPRMPVKAPRLAPDPGFDVWAEAHYLSFRSRLGSVDNNGHFGILYVGIDRLVTPSILLGALVQFDWMNENSATVGSSVKGHGAMAGPYLSVRLTPNTFFDVRAAWGLSANDVDPFGLYTDNFSTSRWLAHAKLTGNWHWQDFRLTPSVAVDYIQEHQRDYTDSLGMAIPSQTVSLGRVSFGPEIARLYIGTDGTTYEPLAALIGEWDFDRPEVSAINGTPVSAKAFHAQAQAGILLRQPGGLSLRIVATYDGIGASDLNAYGGQIWLNLPLH